MLVSRVLTPSQAARAVDLDTIVLLFGIIVIAGVQQEGWSQRLFDLTAPLLQGSRTQAAIAFSTLSLMASNLFSNVPFVMLARAWVPTLSEPRLMWQLLALSSTLAGNLTLVGSVADLIVFEGARERVRVSFWEYVKVGLPATLLSLIVGVAVLVLEHAR